MITYEPLRIILRERGITYRQLRRELGIHPRQAVLLKNDSGYVTLQTIDLLCGYLNVQVGQIIAYVDDVR